MILSETSIDPRVASVFDRISSLLRSASIRFIPIGGMALNQHGVGRPTMDIDLVVKKSDWERASKLLRQQAVNSERLGIPGEKSDAALRFSEGPWVELFPEGTTVEEITRVAGTYRNNPAGRIKLKMDPSLEHLIDLKLASALSSDRLQDAADVQKLILKYGLGEDFARRLSSAVQSLFRKLSSKTVESLVDTLLAR